MIIADLTEINVYGDHDRDNDQNKNNRHSPGKQILLRCAKQLYPRISNLSSRHYTKYCALHFDLQGHRLAIIQFYGFHKEANMTLHQNRIPAVSTSLLLNLMITSTLLH